MRKKDPAILAILLAMSLMTACANGAAGAGTAAPAQAASEAQGAGTEAAAPETAETEKAGADAAADDAGSGAGTSAASEEAASDVASYDETDLDDQWEDENPTVITLSGTDAEVSGRGAAVSDGKLVISEAGTYVLSGAFDGQVLIETGKEDVVHLVLNGAEITSEGAYAIASVKGQKLVVTLADGTDNVLTAKGVADEDNAETEEEEADAAVYVKNELTVNGSGVLNVSSAGKGLHAKDVLRLISGDYIITSADDAFNGKDGVAVEDGSFAVTITDTEEGKGITSKGDVVLNGGTMNISACSEGIEGLTITVNGGAWYVTSADDGMNAREKTESTESTDAAAGPAEGSGASTDTAPAAQDGKAPAEGAPVAPDGTDAADQAASAGENAPRGPQEGGRPEGGFGGRPGGGMRGGFGGGRPEGGMTEEEMANERQKMEYNEKCVITVNGGLVQISAGGDGLDSNGDIVLNGGEVYVSSSEMDMESALDMNGDMFVNGGTLVAAGMQGMAEPLSDESGQPVVTVYYDAVQAAGTELTLSGADGSELASWTVPKQYSMVQVSASGLTTGESCTVTSGSDGKTIEVTAVNTYEGTASRGFGRGFGHGDSPRGQTQTQ